jgi:membrane protease YdiL (CAAX protease family)
VSDDVPPPRPSPRPKGYPEFFRTRWGAIAAAVVGFVLYFVLGQLVPGVLAVVAIAIEHGKVDPEAIQTQLAPYVPHIVLFGTLTSVVMLAALHFFRWLAPAPKGGRGALDAGLAILFATLICVLGQPVLTWILMSADLVPHEQELILAAAESGGAFFIISITVLAPVGEELFFRRFLFSTLRQGTGWFFSYAVSAVAFGLMHGNPGMLPLYLWIAVCATLAYERTGTIWAAMAVHAANNSFAVLFWEM